MGRMVSGLHSAALRVGFAEVTGPQGIKLERPRNRKSRSGPGAPGPARREAGRSSLAPLSEAEDKPQTRFDSGHRFRRNATDAFSEEGAIGGEDLRDVDNRRLLETRAARRNGDVAGQGGETLIGCDDDDEDRCDAAAVEGVGLNHQDGSVPPGSEATGSGKSADQMSPRAISNRPS